MRMILCAALALTLTACGGLGNTINSAAPVAATVADAAGVPAPATIADRTVLDEQALLAVELAYKAERLAIETAVDAGLIKGDRANMLAGLDNRAFLAVTSARAAYSTGNAASYREALTEAAAAVSAAVAAIKGN